MRSPVPLQEARDEAVFGGKAVQLGVALRAQLPVPPGVALPTAFVEAAAQGNPEAQKMLTDLGSSFQYPVAVRSSAVGEDSEAASFAGQHLTLLNVGSTPSLIEAVKAVWESAHSESALAYRRRLELPGEPEVGVVIQRLVPADTAGVLFTVNPLSGVDERVIEATWGLGEAIVSGLVTPDRYRVSRTGVVLERTPGEKDLSVECLAEGGTAECAVASGRINTLCLTDAHLMRLHDLALQCENLFGGNQDLEWAFAGHDLYLLQRRAVTRTVAVRGK